MQTEKSFNFPLIVLASKNEHKLVELRKMLNIPDELFRNMTRYPGAPEPEENGSTFEENALIKARAARDFTGEWALADDSGLEVDLLNGEPGVQSARYAGIHGDDDANNAVLLEKLAAIPDGQRTAHFSCAIALVSPNGEEYVANGKCYGRILHVGRGNNGFGYDPLFLPDGFNKTFAELSTEIKCKFSHRSAAVAEMYKIMEKLFAETEV